MAKDKKPADKPSSKQGQTIEGRADEVKKKKGVSPYTFLLQVRTEAEKVTWTSWKETWISTLMVLAMVVIMAIFFLLVDQTLRFAVCTGLQMQCAAPTQ
ncbi:MAG: preprotein translocase subunit SecE [Parvularculaceae bacterium]